MVVDENTNKTSNGRANWIFVPFSDKNTEKAKNLFAKPLALRMLKLKKLSQQLQGYNLEYNKTNEMKNIERIKKNHYNRLLVTIN